MLGLRIVCPICTEEFGADDHVYSTSCGHLYHLACMRQWQSRSTSCPQCREHNPTTHKIFFNIEEINETPRIDEDLQAKLESSVDKIYELQAQLQESELNFFHIQEQYTTEQNMRKEMQSSIDQFNESESNFLRLHAQFSESEQRLKLLQEENERLTIENEHKTKEIAVRAIEIATLKESLAANKNESSDLIINTKISVLEQKLKHVTLELEKEISNCTQLAIDKIKLQSYIQRMEMLSDSGIVGENNRTKPQHATRCAEINSNISNRPPVASSVPQPICGAQEHKLQNISSRLPVTSANLCEKEQNPGNTSSKLQRNLNNSSIILHCVPLNKISGCLGDTIISIAAKMDIFLTQNDIVKLRTIKRCTRDAPNDSAVYVQFKTEDLKLKFISNRGLLRKDTVFGKVNIKEFVDEKIHAIYLYANRKLRGTVFSHISCMNNIIIAKKNRSDISGTIIHSTEMVNDILAAHLKQEAPLTYEEEDEVDENFYKI